MRVSAPLCSSARLVIRAILLLGVLISPGLTHGQTQPKPGESPVYKVPVLVSDFELYSLPRQKIRNPQQPAPAEKSKTGAPLVYTQTDQPPDQARRFIDFFTLTLVRTLQKRGFSAAHSSGRDVPGGAQLRGVFAEPDAENRIRRAILGAGSPTAQFLLYVGVFNLAREEQPLYQTADPQPSGPQPSGSEYGPVITLNTFVPLAKYEIDKNPTEEDVQKICNQIVTSLVSLLETNPNAFSNE
jgi:hypothetical protein